MIKRLRKFIRAAILSSSLIASAAICNEGNVLSVLPEGFLPFEEFEREFALGNASTERLHPATRHLSQVMHQDSVKGMELLLQVDANVVNGLESFIPSIKKLAPYLAEKMMRGGRIFLVGSGSSGRVAIDLAAKCCAKFTGWRGQIHGVIAGGDSALIRAKEGFEDSEADGEAALEYFQLGSRDTVFLISASGSASFNVGCGHFSANRGASVFYFYNSLNIPSRTQRLFERDENPVIPLCVDIGPQAIGGSTRLQGATLAEACLGALLGSTLYHAQGEVVLSEEYPKQLAMNMKIGLELIKRHLSAVQGFSQKEVEVFSNPHANFRQIKDIADQGYVTFVALEDSMREVLIDSTETSPTFSTHPIRRESEWQQKREEFRAYLMGQGNNRNAWRALVGRNIRPQDSHDTEAFLLSCEEEGIHSFSNRPKGQGNFLIGVAKIDAFESIPHALIQVLDTARKNGGCIGLLLICRGEFSRAHIKGLEEAYDCTIVIEKTPTDALGISETIVLKQLLNLISNSSMILMNKVHGNQMIDVRASNKKLIDRSLRMIKEIWTEYQPDRVPQDKLLYHYLAHVSALKKSYEDRGIYTPSVIKIVLAMLALKQTPENFRQVIEFLAECEERIDWIGGNVDILYH